MPELPEVETIVRTCRPLLEGRQIRAFASSWPKGVLPSVPAVRRALVGQTITRLTRRGKFIVFYLDAGFLLVHLRMSGRFEWADPLRAREGATNTPLPPREGAGGGSNRRRLNPLPTLPLPGGGESVDARRPPAHVRATWDLDDGQRLLFCDARKFGRIIFTRDLPAATAGLGPEPLERAFTPAVLANLLRTRRRQLKPLLLDQSVLAGLGNIYTDEALFRAGLHPAAKSDRLTDAQVRNLHESIRNVLREAIRRHGTTIDWIYPGGWMQKHLRVYGRTGEPCRNCQTPIVALRLAQRGTHICPRCQPLR